ncbi:hypothetical protein ACE6H2_016403 [Prunus campanulata]
MVPKASSVYMSVFIILLLFSSKVAFAKVSHSSETKEKIGAKFQKMKNINVAKKIGVPNMPPRGGQDSVPGAGD